MLLAYGRDRFLSLRILITVFQLIFLSFVSKHSLDFHIAVIVSFGCSSDYVMLNKGRGPFHPSLLFLVIELRKWYSWYPWYLHHGYIAPEIFKYCYLNPALSLPLKALITRVWYPIIFLESHFLFAGLRIPSIWETFFAALYELFLTLCELYWYSMPFSYLYLFCVLCESFVSISNFLSTECLDLTMHLNLFFII